MLIGIALTRLDAQWLPSMAHYPTFLMLLLLHSIQGLFAESRTLLAVEMKQLIIALVEGPNLYLPGSFSKHTKRSKE
jgi:hypothetical protein